MIAFLISLTLTIVFIGATFVIIDICLWIIITTIVAIIVLPIKRINRIFNSDKKNAKTRRGS